MWGVSFWFVFIVHLSRWLFFFFFFSSRRRHTRWTGDWSSDVCSSDLLRRRAGPTAGLEFSEPWFGLRYETTLLIHSRLIHARARQMPPVAPGDGPRGRSEERRVGKECRSRGSAYRLKQNGITGWRPDD